MKTPANPHPLFRSSVDRAKPFRKSRRKYGGALAAAAALALLALVGRLLFSFILLD